MKQKRVLSINKINFSDFDILDRITESDYKKLKLKAMAILRTYTGHYKEFFNSEACFISSNALHGFYFPNYEAINCIAFKNNIAYIII